jgi:hypothetical protein
MLVAGAGLAQQAPNPPAPATAQPEPQPAPPAQSAPPQAQPPVSVRVVDQPMTVRTEGPLPVKVIETPKSDTQFNAEQHERAERSSLYDQLLIYAALLVAVVAFLAIAFAVQTLYLGLGLRSLRRVAQRGERNVQAAQRAFVYTSSHGELPADFDINYVRAPESLFLGPNSNAEFGTLLIPMRDIQAAIEERLHLYVWGRATYEDLFRDSQPHHFNFCHRIEAAGATPDRIELRFGQFGLSNGSDEDSRKADERD